MPGSMKIDGSSRVDSNVALVTTGKSITPDPLKPGFMIWTYDFCELKK